MSLENLRQGKNTPISYAKTAKTNEDSMTCSFMPNEINDLQEAQKQ